MSNKYYLLTYLLNQFLEDFGDQLNKKKKT